MHKFAGWAFSIGMVLFLVAPLVAILPLAFTSSTLLVYPLPSFSLRWFHEIFTADLWRRSIMNSLFIAAGTTVMATFLALLAALGLRRRRGFLVGSMNMLFVLPMVIPTVVLGVGMQLLFVRMGIINSYIGVMIAHTVVAIPFAFVSISGALRGVDGAIERAASSLGASPFATLRFVTVPLILPGLLSAAVLSFAASVDEVVLTLFVAGPSQRTLARQMFSSLKENLSPAIASAAFLYVVGTLVVAIIALTIRRYLSGSKPAVVQP